MSEELRSAVQGLARRNGWDGAALYSVIGVTTRGTFAPAHGVKEWRPDNTAMGLLGLREAMARRLGVPPSPHPPTLELASVKGAWATWTLAAMDVRSQLEVIEDFYRKNLQAAPARPVDYLLVARGAAPRLPLETVIAVDGDPTFAPELDGDGDGRLTVGDLARALERTMGSTSRPEPGPFFDVLWSLGVLVLTKRVFR